MKRIFTSIKFVVLAALCLFVGKVSAQTNLLTNGGFEEWTGSKPTHWITSTSAGNATLAQATEARTGSYAVQVNGASSNKRLGYEEMTLKAGTYTFSFWVKAATEEGASVRPGYVPIREDGSVDASNYKYGDYVNDVTNVEWLNVIHEFTLTEDTEVALVMMNAKKPGKNVLVDDATLTTTDGGIVEGTEEPEEPEVETVGDGTKDNPYTVADVIAQNNPGTTSWVKGYIVGSVKGSPLSENAVFGTAGAVASNLLLAPTAETTDHAQCIPVALPTGDVRSALNLVDNPGVLGVEVSICGSLVAYYSVKGLKEPSEYVLHGTITPSEPTEPVEPVDPDAEGGLNNPYTVETALQLIDDGLATTEKVYVKGKISKIDDVDTGSYGNATYYISMDGTTTNHLEVYRGYYLNGEKFTATDQIHVGDEVVVYGVLTLYKGTTPEITNSELASIVSTGEPVEPELPTDLIGAGTQENPYTVADANRIVESGVTLLDMVYLKGNITEIKSVDTGNYGNAEYFISDGDATTATIKVYRGYYFNGDKFTAEDQIKVGDAVVLQGKISQYNGEPQIAQGSKIITLNGATGGDNTGGGEGEGDGDGEEGDETPVAGEGITIEGSVVTLTNSAVTAGSETITVDLNTYGWENGTKLDKLEGGLQLSDGTVITFNGNGEQNTPAFYTSTKGVRFYKNTGFTISSSTKTIAKVVLNCDSFSGTDYVGNATAGITVEGNNLTYTNVYTEPSGGGVQLRVQTLVIYYAGGDETGIEGVQAATATGAIEVYTLGGVKVGDSLKGLKKGTYILKQGGKARIIIL